MTMYLRRRARFSAAGAGLHPGAATLGFSGVCELTVGGEIDPKSGMVINIRDVDAILKRHVVSVLDGKLLDRDVPEFFGTVPSPENIVQMMWRACEPAMPSGSQLAQVTFWISPLYWATVSTLPLRKDAGPMLTVTRAYDFSASHRLHSNHLSDADNAEIFGKCNWANGHGHNYEVEVTLTGTPDAKTGQVLAPEILDRLVDEEVMQPFDHKHLNYDTKEFADLNPTSENLTRVIWDRLAPRIAAVGEERARLYRVIVRETARNYFEYYGE